MLTKSCYFEENIFSIFADEFWEEVIFPIGNEENPKSRRKGVITK